MPPPPIFPLFCKSVSGAALMSNVKLDEGLLKGDSVTKLLDSAMDAGEGLLRLTHYLSASLVPAPRTPDQIASC